MDHEMREPRERHRKNHRRHRDCSRASSNVTVSSTVPIHNCSDIPSTSAAAASTLAAESISSPAVILSDAEGSVCQELGQQVIRATQNCGKLDKNFKIRIKVHKLALVLLSNCIHYIK